MANSKAPKPTSAKEWKGRISASGLDLELPSNNICRVRPFSIARLISENLLPDSLTPIAQSMVDKGKGKPPADFKKKAGQPQEDKFDAKQMSDTFDLIDRVTTLVVMEPVVLLHKRQVEQNGLLVWEDIPADERDADTLYTDEVSMEDKMFIFNWVVGGTTDLERFRQQFGQSLDGLSASSV